jgi:two-component system alkaline phosphatase synthesis response regulator PhoP
MGETNGLDVCRGLKADPKTSALPIVLVTFKSEEMDIVLGLEMGADDYITKPVRRSEFLARVRAALRRNRPSDQVQTIECGPLRVNLSTYTAWLEEKKIDLTPKQFELLAFFIKMEGKVLTRRVISEAIWGADLSSTSRGIDSAVDQLRRKLGSFRHCVKSLKGVGYRLEVADV